MKSDVRKPAVANIFYPDDRINLKRLINGFLSDVPDEQEEYFHKNSVDSLFGVIVPHAGYFYSGRVAAYAYALLRQMSIDTVVLIGPSHYASFEGFALSDSSGFLTPLGIAEIDTELNAKILEVGEGLFDHGNAAHSREHCLEVQIPFLQSVLGEETRIVPVLMGDPDYRDAARGAEVLAEALSSYEKHTLVVLSTDLSHYHTRAEARVLDQRIIGAIEQMDARKITSLSASHEGEACGAGPLTMFIDLAARLHRNSSKVLCYDDSGTASGDTEKVVGYVSAAVW